MNKENFKRFLSVLLCCIFIISPFGSITASANETYNQSQEYEKINQKIAKALKSDLEPEQIFSLLDQKEVEILSEHYEKYESATVLSLSEEEQKEVEYVDFLANMYYDELVKENSESKLSVMATEDISEAVEKLPQAKTNLLRTAQYYEPADYSVVIRTLGYSYTLDQIARQLVSLGTAINLGAALPFIEMVALIAGAFIVTFSIAILYCAVAVTVNDLLNQWYVSNVEQIKAANRTTAMVVTEYQSGTRYWTAYRVNYFGLGGVAIGNKINFSDAQKVVLSNKAWPDVFCVYLREADILVSGIFGIVGHVGPEAHRNNGQVLNMQHIHAWKPQGEHGKTHVFFAIVS